MITGNLSPILLVSSTLGTLPLVSFTLYFPLPLLSTTSGTSFLFIDFGVSRSISDVAGVVSDSGQFPLFLLALFLTEMRTFCYDVFIYRYDRSCCDADYSYKFFTGKTVSCVSQAF